jgi:hypothetical protein
MALMTIAAVDGADAAVLVPHCGSEPWTRPVVRRSPRHILAAPRLSVLGVARLRTHEHLH